jgi:hypothetical protein
MISAQKPSQQPQFQSLDPAFIKLALNVEDALKKAQIPTRRGGRGRTSDGLEVTIQSEDSAQNSEYVTINGNIPHLLQEQFWNAVQPFRAGTEISKLHFITATYNERFYVKS